MCVSKIALFNKKFYKIEKFFKLKPYIHVQEFKGRDEPRDLLVEHGWGIAREHWPNTRTFITLLHCEIGGLDCHVITAEYRERVH